MFSADISIHLEDIEEKREGLYIAPPVRCGLTVELLLLTVVLLTVLLLSMCKDNSSAQRLARRLVQNYMFLSDIIATVKFFFYKFCPKLLNGGIDEDRAPTKQSLLRWPCPLPSDRAIPVLWQNLESNV